MLDLHSLVLGGGGAKGLVYPKALKKLHDEKQIDLKAVPHVAGASAGALTGFILALGGTPYALERLSPAISEALPFATKQYANSGAFGIAAGRLTTFRGPSQDDLDGSSIPSVLLIWAESALLQILKQIDETLLDDNGDAYLDVDGERYYLNELHARDTGYFWDYEIDPTGPYIPALRALLAIGLRDLRRFGCYLVDTHHKIVSLMKQARINAGWKHLTVTVTRLYHAFANPRALAEKFGSLNYVSSENYVAPELVESDTLPEQLAIYRAFIRHEGVCLMAAAEASGAFPLLFQSTPLGTSPSLRDFLYTDGGCMSNMPAEAPVLVDILGSASPGDCNILALGLNNENEASTLPRTWQMWFAQRAMLPSNHKTIVSPDQTSVFAKLKEKICKTPPARSTDHGMLFDFVTPTGTYHIYYVTREPDAPISLTSDFPSGEVIESVERSINNYANTVLRNLAELLGQAPSRSGQSPSGGGLLSWLLG